MSFYPVDMALPDVPNVIRLRVLGDNNGVPWNNIWYVKYSGGTPTDAEVSDACAGMYAAYTDAGSLSSKWHPETHIDAVEGADLSSTSGAVGIYSHTTSGGGSGPVMGADMSVLCKLFIARRYRGGHPRKYLPPMAANYVTDEEDWDLSTLTALATAFGTALTSNLFTTFGSITVSGLANVSFYEGFTNYVKPSGRAAVRSNVRVSPIVDTVAGFELEQQVATQRRRVGR